MGTRNIRGVVFDFDGLILDTELPAFQSWQEIYQEYGCHLSLSTWASRIGTSPDAFNPLEELETQLGRPVNREEVRRKRRQLRDELIKDQRVLPGVKEYIGDARRLWLKLGVVSSSPRDWVVGHLSRLGILEAFHSIRCSEDVMHTKPDPELYHTALRDLGLTAQQAIALEDSPNGILAAKRAGLFCVAVPNTLTRQLPLDQADLLLNSLADLSLENLLRHIQQAT